MKPPYRIVALLTVLILTLSLSDAAWGGRVGRNEAPRPPVSHRRKLLEYMTAVPCLLSTGSLPTLAADDTTMGARITKAVTKSDLGISVRQSVVQGAKVMDKWDGEWEKFSDRYGLGSERSKRPPRPRGKVIPNPKPLDADIARRILKAADDAFLSATPIRPPDLERQIRQVADTVKDSFARSSEAGGEAMELGGISGAITASQMNFLAYVHYKAYLDLLINRKIDFSSFRDSFEARLGQQLVSILLSDYKQPQDRSMESPPSTTSTELKKSRLNAALKRVDRLCSAMVNKGLVASYDVSGLDDPEQVDDWLEGLTDFSWSIGLGGDICLGSQLLLQEQGFRLYPSLGRLAVRQLLQESMGMTETVTVEDYYMDTEFSPDPEQYEVNEVTLNIVLESP